MSGRSLGKSVERLLGSTRINPRNLIATIYGDMLVPHGGNVWLGSLVEMTGRFGIAEYLSRTTALRLVKEGLLHSTRVGKLSYYSPTPEHMQGTISYYRRTYDEPERDWTGTWRLVLTGGANLDAKTYTGLRRDLLWLGVGQLAPHVFITAAADLSSLEQMFKDVGLVGRIQIMEARAVLPDNPELMRAIVADAWNIGAVEEHYETFLSSFRPIWSQIDKGKVLDPELAFVIRALLIMEYRRIALRDPRLPREYLPPAWAGEMAFALCRNIYQAVLEPSETYLETIVRTADGPIREATTELYARFGGLKRGVTA
ncbi:PaaX family transcriptional regulator [Sphingopyxis sp.]|uniref:PaaX family transcriptional regulator n=1 Tax=Sphingopyxis sp. TaxID=1908224 RepID=UPI003D6DA52E